MLPADDLEIPGVSACKASGLSLTRARARAASCAVSLGGYVRNGGLCVDILSISPELDGWLARELA
jgi:hypothetical protein